MDLSAAVLRNIARDADKVAVVEVPSGRRITYGALAARIESLSSALCALPEIAPGDRVALAALNSIEHVELYLAAARAGLVAQGVNWRLAPTEIARVLEDSTPTVFISSPEFAELAQDLQRRIDLPLWLETGEGGSYEAFVASGRSKPAAPGAGPNDPVLMMYTGGSTGVPKGVVHTSTSLLHAMVNNTVAERIMPSDRYMLIGQMFHSAAVLALNYLYNGATLVLVERYETGLALETIQAEQVTAFLGFTTMFNYMLPELEKPGNGVRLDSLRNLQYGGGPYAPAVVERIVHAFPCGIIQNYGTTEHIGITFLTQEDHDDARRGRNLHRLASGGRAAFLTEVAILDEHGALVPPDREARGEVFVRSGANMVGYWKRPEETASIRRGDWLGTGDVAVWDGDGYVYIVGRAKDMIISGSENIYAAEVERAIATHPAVLETAVIGVPDETWGEAVAAYVVCKPGMHVSEEDVKAAVAEMLGSYQKPRHVWYIDELPKSPNGKLLKQELRDRPGEVDGDGAPAVVKPVET